MPDWQSCEQEKEQTILSGLAGMLLTSGHANALLEQRGRGMWNSVWND